MSLQDKADLLLKEAEKAANAPMMQQLGLAKALLPKIGAFIVDAANENEQRRIESENLRIEMAQLKQKLVGVIGHGA